MGVQAGRDPLLSRIHEGPGFQTQALSFTPCGRSGVTRVATPSSSPLRAGAFGTLRRRAEARAARRLPLVLDPERRQLVRVVGAELTRSAIAERVATGYSRQACQRLFARCHQSSARSPLTFMHDAS